MDHEKLITWYKTLPKNKFTFLNEARGYLRVSGLTAHADSYDDWKDELAGFYFRYVPESIRDKVVEYREVTSFPKKVDHKYKEGEPLSVHIDSMAVYRYGNKYSILVHLSIYNDVDKIKPGTIIY